MLKALAILRPYLSLMEDITMKRSLVFIAMLAVVFTSCGGSTGYQDLFGPPPEEEPCDYIGREIYIPPPFNTQPPIWVFGERPWSGVNDEGERVVYFYAEGRSKQKNMAERSARGNVSAAAAESISKAVLSQFAEAIESFGDEMNEQIEQVRTSLVAFKSKVNVIGQKEAGMFAYQVEKVGGLLDDGCTKDGTKSTNLHAVSLRMFISYQDYQTMRQRAFELASQQASSPEAQEVIQTAQQEIQQTDESTAPTLAEPPNEPSTEIETAPEVEEEITEPENHSFSGVYEEDLLVLINNYRHDNNLRPLSFERNLIVLAKEHSEYQQQKNDLNHDNFSDRCSRAGGSGCVENVGWNYSTPESQFNGWKNSPGHNANMLSASVNKCGIYKAGAYVTFIAINKN